MPANDPRNRARSKLSLAAGVKVGVVAHGARIDTDNRGSGQCGHEHGADTRPATGDRAPGEKQVPHQKAPETPTTPRENNPPRADVGNLQWRGQEKLAGETNYFIGNDRAKWRTHVPHFSRAIARRALPGVDVVVYGNEDALEYD